MNALIRYTLLTVLMLPAGCAWITDDEESARWDVDGDEIRRPADCDDGDDAIGKATLWFRDRDRDGFGDATDSEQSCKAPDGYVDNGDDCNDGSPEIHPEAPEICNGEDDDCSGEADDNITLVTYFLDSDGDGQGDPDVSTIGCAPPSGHVTNSDDCDDSTDAIFLGAEEHCDGIDNNCENGVDELSAIDPSEYQWWPDHDGDTYGDATPGTVLQQCDRPTGYGWPYVQNDGDCQDQPSGRPGDPAPELINPGVVELCDGVDNNCDGSTDENAAVDAPTWYYDYDHDGFGDLLSPQNACVRPTFHVSNFGDCDDADGSTHPAAAELCDGVDNDCDTRVDDDDFDTQGQPFWYLDLDADGFGDEVASSIRQCVGPTGYVPDPGDCDDADPAKNPIADEICDGIDNDCDGKGDEADPDLLNTELLTWYFDNDGDGFGSPVQPAFGCTAPPQYVPEGTDCNDFDARTFPGATEICDSLDNDCDGDPDDGIEAFWHFDVDGDGWGVEENKIWTCNPPPGRVSQAGDCDDADPARFPGNPEICDGIDNDCDAMALVDEADPNLEADTWYADTDGDGHGNAADVVIDCVQPANYVPLFDDCDDSNATIFSGALELCDGVDNDCDLLVDDDDPTLDPTGNSWYQDRDGDTFGAGAPVLACTQPDPGWEIAGGDCSDEDPTVFPTAPELCDDKDNDCDLLVDDDDDPLDIDPTSSRQAYYDADADGHGDPSTPWPTLSCSEPAADYVFDDTDCRDDNPDIYEGAPELCDSLDNNCNTYVDEYTPITWFEDADDDGRGNALVTLAACFKPDGFVFDDTDCNDANAAVYPDAPELCDGIENDCDGLVDDDDDDVQGTVWFTDNDEDGYGQTGSSVIACIQPAFGTFSTVDGDCDDIQAIVNPLADEICDFIDNDCDALTDDEDVGDLIGATTWYPDGDLDDYGDGSAGMDACDQPEFHVADGTDCLDDDFKINPGAEEVCDGVDNDCDGDVDDADADVTDQVTWFSDSDGDGFGAGAALSTECFNPGAAAANALDCDDADALDYPGAFEKCDGQDNDCNGIPDDGAIDRTWCKDLDLDGWGSWTPADCTLTCNPPAGYVPNAFDCDDTNLQIGPGNPELCDDGLDNDCDGAIDAEDPIAIGGSPQYRDADGDGFGDPSDSIFACGEPGYVDNNLDCNDLDPTIYGGAPLTPADVEDGVDRDCDNRDECYIDADGDGYIGATVGPDNGDGLCDDPGEGLVWDDCHDDNASAFPGAVVTAGSVGDGIDQDCLNGEECFVDTDGDGDGQNVIRDDDGDFVCDGPGESATNTDCDDTNPTVYLDAPELCGDGIDNDCDGLDETLDPTVAPVPWYADDDGDGFGNPLWSVVTCDQPANFTKTGDDCDDSSPYAATAFPGATEICDGVDNDCDGLFDDNDPDLIGGPCVDQPWFSADFECADGNPIGLDSVRNGWQAAWAGDLWGVDNGTAHPTVDSTGDTQGLPPLASENFLLVGHPEWRDQRIEASVFVGAGETGAIGLVGRYPNANNYASCLITRDLTPGCNAPVSAGDRAVLAKVDPSTSCVADDDYTVDSAPYTYPNDTWIRMRLEVIGGDITCTIDADLDGTLGSGGDIVLFHTDASPLSSGRAGLAVFGMSSLGRFDDLTIDGDDVDLDRDGLIGGAAGPDGQDPTLGLFASDTNSDVDGDAVIDRDEALNFRFNTSFPPDTDGDGALDINDTDSDDDGWPDSREAGDADLLTPPVDTDCDGAPDIRDEDSDGDGVLDVDDICRRIADPGQTDTDNDGAGDACDANPTVADPDGDFLNDGLEAFLGTDPAVADTDGDGLLDGEEFAAGTDALRPDTDRDGLSDGDEASVYGTQPTVRDTDGGGAYDGEEVDRGTDPLVAGDDVP